MKFATCYSPLRAAGLFPAREGVFGGIVAASAACRPRLNENAVHLGAWYALTALKKMERSK
jgi:hypothetical protein